MQGQLMFQRVGPPVKERKPEVYFLKASSDEHTARIGTGALFRRAISYSVRIGKALTGQSGQLLVLQVSRPEPGKGHTPYPQPPG